MAGCCGAARLHENGYVGEKVEKECGRGGTSQGQQRVSKPRAGRSRAVYIWRRSGEAR